MAKIQIETWVEPEQGKGHLEASLEGLLTELSEMDRAEGEKFFWASLLDEEGRMADQIFPLPLEEIAQFCMEVPEVRLWDGERVYLYELRMEVRDREERVLKCICKKTAFFYWECRDGKRRLNGKNIRWRGTKAEFLQNRHWQEAEVRRILEGYKREYYNTLVTDCTDPWIGELCLEYGLYLVSCREWEEICQCRQITDWKGAPDQKNPDFELNVVQQGVLIENHSTFVNVREFELCFWIEKEMPGEVRILEADVPAGSSLYVELPFDRPEETGEYRCCVALRLKRDTAWAPAGSEVAAGQCRIANFYLCPEGAADLQGMIT